MQLKIRLKSDLCAAVGKHYAAMIDLDTALDEYGIPYIPSRRIKGCLREIAQLCTDEEDISRIFGKPGSNRSGSLRLSDAHIKGYRNVIDEIQANHIPAEKVTQLFCSVRGETAIENDTAKKSTLRYIRVVNMTAPGSDSELEFYADVDFDEADKALIKKWFGALRNIGYHRNRGLGAVECRLAPCAADIEAATPKIADFDNCEAIRITLRLDGDLMLPDTDANHSTDYISGTMLLGALAAKYTAKYADDEGFNDIFFSDVRFGNLYPAVVSYDEDAAGYHYTVPAPRYFAKIKAAKGEDLGIHNIIGKDKSAKQYKPLKKGYISEKYGLVTPEKKIVYHNANTKTEEQGLYMQYCLACGQYFSGVISGSTDKIRKIAGIFFDRDGNFDSRLRFGRSKTAQYSSCTVCEFRSEPADNSYVPADTDCIAAYRLESDVCLSQNAVPTADTRALCLALKVDYEKLLPETSVATKTVSGYNAKWNMKKPRKTVISAGSTLVFKMPDGLAGETRTELPLTDYIGDGQNEGYGKVRLILHAQNERVETNEPVKMNAVGTGTLLSDLIRQNSKLEKISAAGIKAAHTVNLKPAQLGRIALMAKDADKAAQDKFIDFEKRLYSIKTASTAQSARRSFDAKALEKELWDFGIPFTECNVRCGKDDSETLTLTVPDSEWKYVYQYIITALTVRKYQLRKEGENDD